MSGWSGARLSSSTRTKELRRKACGKGVVSLKRALVSAVGACLVALSASGIGLAASFNPSTGEGFVSRGDVIAALGKDALVLPQPYMGPIFYWNGSRDWTQDCLYSDGTSKRVTSSTLTYTFGVPQARLAGNGTITGYFYSWVDAIDSDTVPPTGPPGCWDTPPPVGAELVGIQGVSVSHWYDTHLYFGGVELRYRLVGG